MRRETANLQRARYCLVDRYVSPRPEEERRKHHRHVKGKPQKGWGAQTCCIYDWIPFYGQSPY